MKKYLKKIAYFLTVVIVFGNSCADSFLNLEDTSTLKPENFPTKVEDLEYLITSCYVFVSDFNLYGKRVMAKGSFVTDHTVDLAFTEFPEWNTMATNNLSSDNEWLETLWFGYYKMVNASNLVLEVAGRFDVENMDQKSQTRFEQITGEAYFWRAWAYQQLLQFFGEGYPCNGDGGKQGVVLFTENQTSIQAMNIPRSTVDEVYTQVISDYKAAESRLPDKWDNITDMSRPTKYSVKSFLGQVYLFQGNYDLTKTELKNVIDNSGKSLLPFDDYAKMFNEDQIRFNNESIQEINFKDHSASGWGNWGGGEGSMHAMVISLCVEHENGDPDQVGWSNLFFHDANIDRFGNDPRLHIAALEPGTKLQFGNEEVTVMKYIIDKDDYDVRGWAVKKYNPLTYSTYAVEVSVGINMYLMRLADVYLMYAEACQATNDEGNAREYLNRVRRRAFNQPVDTPSGVDITSSGTQLRDDIREERFLELCAEGIQHWVDVCRWKTLDKEINQWYKMTAVGPPVYSSSSLYYPIPKAEMERNTAMTQSEGYINR